jgi:hypothetical protein
LRVKALESVSDVIQAVFSSAFGHFRFNRRALCGVRGRNAAKQRRHSLRRGSGSCARRVVGCGPDRLGQRQRKFVDLKRDGERVSGQRLHEDEDGEGEEDVFGIAAARGGKFLRFIQTKRMG